MPNKPISDLACADHLTAITQRGPGARLSAYARRDINVHGHYWFRLPDLGDAWRPLRDPDQRDPDGDD